MADKGYDGQTDAPLDALAALAWAALVADLGTGIAARVFKEPRPAADLDEADLPALCVYRTAERWQQRDSTTRIQIITFTFDFMLPGANVRDEREVRWPTLQAVWLAITTAVLNGGHLQVDDGVDLLDAAGMSADPDSPQVRYELVTGGRETDAEQHARRPFLRGSILVEYEVPEDYTAANLAPFLRFAAKFKLPGADGTVWVDGEGETVIGDDVTDRIMIDLNLTLEGYSPWP